jgi:hypothetical protein
VAGDVLLLVPKDLEQSGKSGNVNLKQHEYSSKQQ